jgi:hypothetical protein
MEKLDQDNAVTVEVAVVDGRVDLSVNFGRTFGQFMLARG